MRTRVEDVEESYRNTAGVEDQSPSKGQLTPPVIFMA